MMKKLLSTCTALALLSGCAMSKIEPGDVALEQARADARAACVRARADADQARMRTISTMDPGSQGYALMADAMARQAEALAGKDVCASGMGAYEARAHEVESRNKVVEGLGGKLITGSIVGAGIYTAGRVAEKSIENAGDQTNIQGDGNSYTQERVSSNADITSKNFGEGGTATSGAPTVSGPDKSSHTTIEAAEEPVVEEPEVEEPEGEFVPTEPPDFPEGPVEIPGPPSAE